MKHCLKPIFALAALAVLTATSVQAETEEKMVIALKTDSFELLETDVSTLAIGEAKTIETDSGKVIDVLRTADGVELYVDGELLEMDFGDESLHQEHMIKKHVEVICDDEEDCDKHVVILSGDEDDDSRWVTQDGENVFIHEEIEITCTDDEEDGITCSDKVVLISDGEEIDFEELHEKHMGGDGHKVIVIKKEIDTEG